MHAFLDRVVSNCMTQQVNTVPPTMTLGELGDLFEKDDFNTFPVVENSHVVGVISKFDFLASFIFTSAHMIPRYEELMAQTVADVMTPDFIYVRVETALTRVLQLMVDHRIRSMPVIENDQRLVGMISREDIMRVLKGCARGGG